MKYALIGCGRIAVNHMKAAINNKLEIVAVCDVLPEKMEALPLDIGTAQLAAGNAAEAVKSYKTIADKYPSSMEARDIEKYIGVAEQK